MGSYHKHISCSFYLAIYLFLKGVFIYLRERVREHAAGRDRENLKQTAPSAEPNAGLHHTTPRSQPTETKSPTSN